MSKITTSLVLALLLVQSACSVGTVTASSRFAGAGGAGGGGSAGLGGIAPADSPRNVEAPGVLPRAIETPMNADRADRADRNFQLDQDCWRCR